MTGHRAPLRSGVRDWDTRLPKRLQLFRGMRYPVQAPRTILNRNWSAGDSLPSFREANFGESNKGLASLSLASLKRARRNTSMKKTAAPETVAITREPITP